MSAPYYVDEFVTLYHGDALKLLPELAQQPDRRSGRRYSAKPGPRCTSQIHSGFSGRRASCCCVSG